MNEILTQLPPNFWNDMIFGAVGAVLLVIYRVYNSIPEIETLLQWGKEEPLHINMKHIGLLSVKIFLSLASAALLTALIVKPQDVTGALVSGMGWTGLIKGYIK